MFALSSPAQVSGMHVVCLSVCVCMRVWGVTRRRRDGAVGWCCPVTSPKDFAEHPPPGTTRLFLVILHSCLALSLFFTVCFARCSFFSASSTPPVGGVNPDEGR